MRNTPDQIKQEIRDIKYGLGFLNPTPGMIELAKERIANLQKRL